MWPQDHPRRWASSRVRCIGWFDSGRVIDPIVLDGAILPERLHSGRDHRHVPFRPCEGNQSIFVTPTADHRVGVRCPSRWHADVARQIARRLLYGVDRQSPKPGLKGGSSGWIDLDTKDANDHRKTGERWLDPHPVGVSVPKPMLCLAGRGFRGGVRHFGNHSIFLFFHFFCYCSLHHLKCFCELFSKNNFSLDTYAL